MSGARLAPRVEKRIKSLLGRRVSGAVARANEEIERACVIAAVIDRRWQVPPTKWRLKHVQWFAAHGIPAESAWQRYRYRLTLQRLLDAMGKPRGWRDRLPANTPPSTRRAH